MSYLFETEEEEQTRDKRSGNRGRRAGSDAEITLGTRSLLGIFFGLVLICGVFFGLGYSVGRVGSARAAAPSPGDTPEPIADNHLQKPSADQQTLTPVPSPTATDDTSGAPSPNDTAPTQNAAGTPPPAAAAPSGAPAPVRTVVVPTSTPAPTLAPAALTQPAATSGTFVVQVAAVRVAQDADILVAALKKHGYIAVVRNEPQDQLLHVQLGPFTTRMDAMAMRSRLLADGYNAVLK
jgi:cell division septation protein DedD